MSKIIRNVEVASESNPLICDLKKMSGNEIHFAENYSYSLIVNYILQFTTDVENSKIENDILDNKLLVEKMAEARFYINEYSISDFDQFKQLMKKKFYLDIT